MDKLTWQQVYPVGAGCFRHIDVNHDFAVFQGYLQGAIIEITEEEQPVGVPRTKLEAHGYRVVIGSAWQLQEAGGVKKDREGVGLHAGEWQVTLSRQIEKEKDTNKERW